MNPTSPDPLIVAGTLHVTRRGRGARKVLCEGPKPVYPTGRVPRVARLMALAGKFEGLLRDGIVTDYADLARLGHVTRARITQIMNLLHLAPDLQEQLLFLPRVERGRDPIVLRDLQPIAAQPDWRIQRKLWSTLRPIVSTTGAKSGTNRAY